jgi:hypothetical protein
MERPRHANPSVARLHPSGSSPTALPTPHWLTAQPSASARTGEPVLCTRLACTGCGASSDGRGTLRHRPAGLDGQCPGYSPQTRRRESWLHTQRHGRPYCCSRRRPESEDRPRQGRGHRRLLQQHRLREAAAAAARPRSCRCRRKGLLLRLRLQRGCSVEVGRDTCVGACCGVQRLLLRALSAVRASVGYFCCCWRCCWRVVSCRRGGQEVSCVRRRLLPACVLFRRLVCVLLGGLWQRVKPRLRLWRWRRSLLRQEAAPAVPHGKGSASGRAPTSRGASRTPRASTTRR